MARKKEYDDVSCKKTNCAYYNSDMYHAFGCLYAQMEQKSKLSQIPPGETYDIENCQFYAPRSGRKKVSPEIHPPTEKVDPKVLRGANKLSKEPNALIFYDMQLNDKDIGKIYEVPARSVAHWRKVHGLGSGHESKRLNWKEIIDLMKEGYSDLAIARLVNTDKKVITEYRRTEASHNV